MPTVACNGSLATPKVPSGLVGKISADQVFYLMSRGLTENEAQNLIVQGFLEVFTKELPMEYAIEFNRLVKMEMEGSLG
jgi:Fe-S cluster assembly protein SufB